MSIVDIQPFKDWYSAKGATYGVASATFKDGTKKEFSICPATFNFGADSVLSWLKSLESYGVESVEFVRSPITEEEARKLHF